MSSPLDFNVALGEQLRDAAEQMRAMSKPQKKGPKATAEGDGAQSTDTTSKNTADAPASATPAAQGKAPAVTANVTADQTDAQTAPAKVATTARAGVVATDAMTGDAAGGATVGFTTGITAGLAAGMAAEVTHAMTAKNADDTTAQRHADCAHDFDHDATHATHSDTPRDNSTVAKDLRDSHGSSQTDTSGAAHAATTTVTNTAPHDKHEAVTETVSRETRSDSPTLPDAASELWAMSQHSGTPTLSERSWSGGVRGAVLDALRLLAADKDHVLVNLKRLATHTGISYGSVRNAMSRLTRSGDIRTRQIRMADGHGVRVEFLTLRGQEGTGQALYDDVMAQAMSQNVGPNLGSHLGQSTGQSGTHNMGHSMGQSMGQHMVHSSHAGVMHGSASVAGVTGAPHTVSQAVTVAHAAQAAVGATDTMTHAVTEGMTHAGTVTHANNYTSAQHAGQPTTREQGGADASQHNAFWQTTPELFALAWPHVADAGLSMTELRSLAPIFAVQGFDASVLPRCLRYLDWELESYSPENTNKDQHHAKEEHVRLFVRGLQRRGSWPRPEDYPEEA